MTSEQSQQALRPASGGMMTVSLSDEITRLKSTREWHSGDRHAATLIKNTPLNVLLMVLKKGARLHEHRTKGPIALQVLSGSIRFTADTEHVISANQIVGLHPNVPHSVEALEESAVVIITAIA